MKPRINKSHSFILINDIFDELSEENKRLNEELIFANNCLNVLKKFKSLLNKVFTKSEETIDLNDKQELNQLEEEFTFVIDCKNQKNDTNVEELTKTGYSENEINDKNNKLIELTNQKINSVTNNKNFREEVDTDCEVSDGSDKQISNRSEDEIQVKNKRNKTYIQRSRSQTLQKLFKCQECGNGFAHRTSLNNHKRIHSNEWFECDFVGCGKKFKKSILLKSHIKRIHTLERPFKCHDCDKAFLANHELKDHQSIHSGHTFKCEECHKVFKKESLLKIHRRTHLLNQNNCDLCDFKTKYLDSLKNHIIRAHTSKKPFKCKECNKTFVLKNDLKIHEKALHSGLCFKCDSCDFETKKKYSLKLHIKFKHNVIERTVKCDYEDCPKMFKDITLMKNHKAHFHMKQLIQCDWPGCEVRVNKYQMIQHIRRYHTLEKPFKCKDCDKAFVTKYILKCHQQIHSGIGFKCEECHKVFDNELHLRRHKLRVHLPNRKVYKCEFCDFKAKGKEHLKDHTEVKHTIKEKTIKCDVEGCHKMFKNMIAMRRHRNKIHIHTKSFVCDWPGCDHKYKTKYQLGEHKESHIGLRQYKCDFEGCGKSYVTKRDLKQHQLYHKLEIMCSWPECNGRFPTKHSLTVHMNKHLNIKPFKCIFDGCPSAYHNPHSLRFHIKTVHNH